MEAQKEVRRYLVYCRLRVYTVAGAVRLCKCIFDDGVTRIRQGEIIKRLLAVLARFQNFSTAKKRYLKVFHLLPRSVVASAG